MKWSSLIFRSALMMFLLGATFVAAAQFCFDDVALKQKLALIGFASLYLATVALGSIGICTHRLGRLAARRREDVFLRLHSPDGRRS
jgi:hypothetical protein